MGFILDGSKSKKFISYHNDILKPSKIKLALFSKLFLSVTFSDPVKVLSYVIQLNHFKIQTEALLK